MSKLTEQLQADFHCAWWLAFRQLSAAVARSNARPDCIRSGNIVGDLCTVLVDLEAAWHPLGVTLPALTDPEQIFAQSVRILVATTRIARTAATDMYRCGAAMHNAIAKECQRANH